MTSVTQPQQQIPQEAASLAGLNPEKATQGGGLTVLAASPVDGSLESASPGWSAPAGLVESLAVRPVVETRPATAPTGIRGPDLLKAYQSISDRSK